MSTVIAEKKSVGESPVAGQIRGLAPEARELAAVSPRLVLFNFGYWALAWAVAIGAIALFWAYPAWYTLLLAFLVVSSRQQALLNCHHECVHRKFVPSPRWNELIGRYLCAAPVGSPYAAARARHLSHHRLLGTPDDPDRDLHSGESKRTRKGLLGHFVGGLLGGYAGMILMGPRVSGAAQDAASKRQDLISLVLVQGLIAGAMTVAFAWWVYPALWLAPLLTVTVLCHLVRSFVEHAISEDETSSHRNRLITIPSNLIERSMVAPYWMNYHAEHHILPSVPAPRLRQLQKRLDGREEVPPVLVRSSYGGAILRFMRSLRD
jgi:fatty acid desaturase